MLIAFYLSVYNKTLKTNVFLNSDVSVDIKNHGEFGCTWLWDIRANSAICVLGGKVHKIPPEEKPSQSVLSFLMT